jgi:Flp pilus assembly protein TadD
MAKRSTKKREVKPQSKGDDRTLSGRRDRPPAWLVAILLALFVGIIYGPSFHVPFIFDDKVAIGENRSIVSLSPLVGSAEHPSPLNPPPDLPTSGRPLVNLSLAMNYRVGGLNPFGYHMVNALIHFASAMLVWAIVRRTLRLPYFQARFEAAAGWFALLVSVLWALHPLQTEAVIYTTQRTELMMALFYLATLYCSLRYWATFPLPYRETPGEGSCKVRPTRALSPDPLPKGEGSKGLWLTLAILACLAGMASKEVMFSAPLVVLLFERTFITGSIKESLRRSWPLYCGLAASWIVLLSVSTGSPHGKSAGFGLGINAYDWWLVQSKVFWMYWKLVLWPWPLLLHYEVPYFDSFAEAWMYVVPLLLVGIAVLVLLWRNHPLGFLGAWIFAILSPTLAIPIPLETAAERRMYLALLPFIAAVVVLIDQMAESLMRSRPDVRANIVGLGKDKRTVIVCGLLLAALFGVASRKRLRAYDDEGVLWREVLQAYPEDSMAHNNLGTYLLDHNELAEAISHLQLAVRFQPDYPIARNNLGLALVRADRSAEAVPHFEHAVGLRPEFGAAHNNLGQALTSLGRLSAAERELHTALALQPDEPAVLNNLGMMLATEGKVPEAIDYFNRALQLKPDNVDAHNNLGVIYIRSGKTAEALAEFRLAHSLKPDDANAIANLALLLSDIGKLDEAIDLFPKAATLMPGRADIQFKFAKTLERAGRPQEAVGRYQSALRLRPDFVVAYASLAQLLASERRFSEAITTAKKGAEAARLSNQPRAAEQLEHSMSQYQQELERK